MLSDELTNLREFFVDQDGGGVWPHPELVATISAVLKDAAAQARQIERQAVPPAARVVALRRRPKGNILYPDFYGPARPSPRGGDGSRP